MDSSTSGLLNALRRLDATLSEAVAAIRHASQPDVGHEFRSLYISVEEVDRLLDRDAGHAVERNVASAPTSLVGDADAIGPLARMRDAFGLAPFDLDTLIVALAPEVELRYQRLYGYLQDDLTRKLPSVELVLSLLCGGGEEKLHRRAHFATDAPLIHHGLVKLLPDSRQEQSGLLSYSVKADDQVVRWILEQPGLDSRLSACCRAMGGAEERDSCDEVLFGADIARTSLPQLLRIAYSESHALRLYLRGQSGSGRLRLMVAAAAELGAELLVCDVRRLPESVAEFEATLELLLREAWWRNAMVLLRGVEWLQPEEKSVQLSALLHAVAEHQGIIAMAGGQRLAPHQLATSRMAELEFEVPGFASRRAYWKMKLTDAGITLGDEQLDELAGRFRVTPGQIDDAVYLAREGRPRHAEREAIQASGDRPSEGLSLADLFAAARAQCGHELAKLSRKVTPQQDWNNLVLPPDQVEQLREICQQARYRHVVYGEWGFDRKLSLGKGLNVLFAGPPGTGKTMAAEVIARELQLDLYKIDLSQVVSKYIGETEKNLNRIFTAAESASAILFFDEADALFGKRSEVRDSHDRYANIEIGYLLQKMEEYEGIAILATNLLQNLDDAFTRRMQFVVDFPFPDEEHRRRIWQVMFPGEASLADDLNFGALAREIKLAGGNLKNIAVSAAFYAAADGKVIHVAHVARAARREHQKLGRTWSESSLQANETESKRAN